MPMPISLAHKMAKKLTQVRKDGILDYLRPDGKTQVTVEYDDDKPVRVDAVLYQASILLMLIFKNFVKILREKLF